jgi:peptide/nickel transport system permease protein
MVSSRQTSEIKAVAPTTGKLRRAWKKYDLAIVGGVFFAFVLFCTIFAPFLTPYDPTLNDIKVRLQGPSLLHPFGTDQFGRDLLARVLYGGRPILLVSFLSVATALAVGVVVGMSAAYWGGWLDSLLMRLMDVLLSFPSVLLAILIVAALGPGLSNVMIAITVSMIPIFSRLVRSVVVTLVNEDYVAAAKALGAVNARVIARHIFPNMISAIIVQASALLAVAIGTATALNFLGLGVEPPTPDWGLMVSDGQKLIFDAPHVPLFPGLVITLTVLSVNYIGDGLRDRLDPRLRGQG